MKKCKKILHLLSIFALVSSVPLFSQTYSSIDFNRLVLKHPMMKNFDPETGRFRNTPSEIIPVARLKLEIENLQKQIKTRESEKKDKLNDILATFSSKNNEEDAWQKINSFDHSLSEIKAELDEKNRLLSDLGIPGYEKVLAVVRTFFLEIMQNFEKNGDIILNTLPRFPLQRKPDFGRANLRSFFMEKNTDTLREYIKKKSLIGMLFRKVYQPVLFNKAKEKQE